MSFADKGFPELIEHPFSGPGELDSRVLAIRWHQGGSRADKQRLVDDAGLVDATVDADDRRPTMAVNRTEGLWWVALPAGQPATDGLVDRLQASTLVDWVAPGYRAGAAGATARPAPELGVYAVNPTRVYVRKSVTGATSVEPHGLRSETGRTSRLKDYELMRVHTGTALTAAKSVVTSLSPEAGARGDAVRFETIPFVSPATSVTARPSARGFNPDDPQFGTQWGLRRMQVPQAWRIQRADPAVAIAVIDTGVELTHPDLSPFPQSWNASSDTPDGRPVGDHGTACAGIAAALLDNQLGVAGVAGGAQVMAIATETFADVDIAEGLYFAADNGARVVSMSFGVYPEWGVWDFDVVRDALQYAYDQGLLLVAAAGNEDGGVARFPGSDARTLCVGGSNRADERKRVGDTSSEPWWGASYGPDLDVVAPCLEIPTTDRLGTDGYSPDDYFGRFNGTSAATPHVAGLGALLFSLRPDLDNVGVRHLIERTCDKISPNRYAYRTVAGKPSGTWHAEVGYGRVNAERALLAAQRAGDGQVP